MKRKHTDPHHLTAAAEYDRRMGIAIERAETILRLLKARRAEALEADIHWGHAGDAGCYCDELATLFNRLTQQGEFAPDA
jgi:hypothetical protein